MKLADLLEARLVEPELSAVRPEETLQRLVARLVDAGYLAEGRDALERLEERERVMTTGIGGGVAVPHARSPQVERTLMVIGRSREGVPFNALDGAPVRVVFLILGPPDAFDEHVSVLAGIARLVKKPGFLEAMQEGDSADQLMATVRRFEATG